MGFVAELKQRKVFRVATVYLVVAWLAIQVASIALPAFDAPVWVMRTLILVFALGFPMALLMAWALEVTPEGIRMTSAKAGNRRMAWIAAGLAALALAWFFYGQPALRKADLAAAMPERSIAVLPFVNMSGDPANEYFSDGIAETTLDMLSRVEDLKVIARTSSFAFKGKTADMREIGKALGAAHLLEGSVQQAGDTVRITVQLIRVADGSHLWSRQFDRKLQDVFRIQDEIATSVVQALQVALREPEQKRLLRKRTDSVAAYQEYLKGTALLPGRKVPDMRRALQHFERAIELDPDYAQAYVGARDAYSLLSQYAYISDEEQQRGLRYLERALALAPDLGEAHIARAAVLENAGKLDEADREYRLGLKLAPGYATGHQWYGEFLAFSIGRMDEAMVHFDQAYRLDPLSPVIRDVRLFAMAQAGRVDEALALSNQLIAEHPDVARNYDTRSSLYEQQGNIVAALADLRMHERLDPESVGFRSHRCYLLIGLGLLAEAQACLDPLVAAAPTQGEVMTAQMRLLAATGRGAEALALAESVPEVNPRFRAGMMLGLGRDDEALALAREFAPTLLTVPPPALTPAQAVDALLLGAALVRTGDEARGRPLMEAAIASFKPQPYGSIFVGQGWSRFQARSILGEADQAFAALKEGVDAGYFLGLAELDSNPLLVPMRADPRYEAILAPARARLAQEIAAARKAGLL